MVFSVPGHEAGGSKYSPPEPLSAPPSSSNNDHSSRPLSWFSGTASNPTTPGSDTMPTSSFTREGIPPRHHDPSQNPHDPDDDDGEGGSDISVVLPPHLLRPTPRVVPRPPAALRRVPTRQHQLLRPKAAPPRTVPPVAHAELVALSSTELSSRTPDAQAACTDLTDDVESHVTTNSHRSQASSVRSSTTVSGGGGSRSGFWSLSSRSSSRVRDSGSSHGPSETSSSIITRVVLDSPMAKMMYAAVAHLQNLRHQQQQQEPLSLVPSAAKPRPNSSSSYQRSSHRSFTSTTTSSSAGEWKREEGRDHYPPPMEDHDDESRLIEIELTFDDEPMEGHQGPAPSQSGQSPPFTSSTGTQSLFPSKTGRREGGPQGEDPDSVHLYELILVPAPKALLSAGRKYLALLTAALLITGAILLGVKLNHLSSADEGPTASSSTTPGQGSNETWTPNQNVTNTSPLAAPVARPSLLRPTSSKPTLYLSAAPSPRATPPPQTKKPIQSPTTGPSWTPVATVRPSREPSWTQPENFRCFQSPEELRQAVDEYMTHNSSLSLVAQTYGWPMGTWCVSEITDFNDLFSASRSSYMVNFDEDLSLWNMSNAETLGGMFRGALSFNRPLGSWDVSRVVNMSTVFQGAVSFNQDLNAWNVENVQDMTSLFRSATSFNQPLDRWNVTNVQFMTSMFESAKAFDQDLSSWNVTGVRRMLRMFRDATSFNQDLSSWRLPNAVTIKYMFSGARSFRQNLCSWGSSLPSSALTQSAFQATACPIKDNPSFIDSAYPGPFCEPCSIPATKCFASNEELTDAVDAYLEDSSFDTATATTYGWPIGNWCVDDIDNFNYLFAASRTERASAFNEDLSKWNTSHARYMISMFDGAVSFNHDISRWNVSSVINMRYMFQNASAFNHSLVLWDTSSLLDMTGTFQGSTAFNGDISTWDVSRVMFMSRAFQSATAFNSDISRWNTSMVVDFSRMFDTATSFDVDLSSWNIGSAQLLSAMFQGASSFDQNLCSWGSQLDTSAAVDTMFLGSGCQNDSDPLLDRIAGFFCSPCES